MNFAQAYFNHSLNSYFVSIGPGAKFPSPSHQHANSLAKAINHAVRRKLHHPHRKTPTLICASCASKIGHHYNGSHSLIGLAIANLSISSVKRPCHICHAKFKTIYSLSPNQPIQK